MLVLIRNRKRPECRRVASRKNMIGFLKKYYIFYLLFLPLVVYLLVFEYAPLGGLIIAFKDYSFGKGIFGSPWTSEYGFHHFIRILTNGEFLRVFKNTIILASMNILLGFPAPILFALLLNELRSQKYKRFLQTISYLPHFVSFVVVYAVLYNFLSYDGFFNMVRGLFGAEPILFLGNPKTYRWVFVLSAIWKEIGWSAIIYLAALSNVNMDLYEAADIDGASRLQKQRYITLAELRPIISIQFILSMGGIFNVNFDQTLVMLNDMVMDVGEVTSYYVYKTGLLTINQFSYATAVGLLNSILGFGMVMLTNVLSKKMYEDGGLW